MNDVVGAGADGLARRLRRKKEGERVLPADVVAGAVAKMLTSSNNVGGMAWPLLELRGMMSLGLGDLHKMSSKY